MPNDTRLAQLQRLRKLSDLWDRSIVIPGIKFRIGLESIVGLIPVGGDAIGILLSIYILFQSLQFRLPPRILAKMLFNIILDAVVGSIPILGDLFDTTWKANTRNVNLLEAHLRVGKSITTQQTDKWLFILIFGVLILVIIVLVSLFISIIWLLMKYLITH